MGVNYNSFIQESLRIFVNIIMVFFLLTILQPVEFTIFLSSSNCNKNRKFHSTKIFRINQTACTHSYFGQQVVRGEYNNRPSILLFHERDFPSLTTPGGDLVSLPFSGPRRHSASCVGTASTIWFSLVAKTTNRLAACSPVDFSSSVYQNPYYSAHTLVGTLK